MTSTQQKEFLMANRDKLEKTHDRLMRAVASITSGEDWRRMLDVAGRFHTYSPGNVFLVLAQRPDATRVAGFNTWRKLGRQVKAGEHGIAILAPCLYRAHRGDGEVAEDAEESRALRGFRVVHVFDLEQTVGQPLEEVAPVSLAGDAPAELWERLAAQVAAAGFHLLRGDCRPANATTHFHSRAVVVGTHLSPAQACKSLCHELAHVRLHDGGEYARGCRGVTEVEAESVAYLVCSAAGLPTEEYTFPYVALWAGGDVKMVRQTSARVIGCAREILRESGLGSADGGCPES